MIAPSLSSANRLSASWLKVSTWHGVEASGIQFKRFMQQGQQIDRFMRKVLRNKSRVCKVLIIYRSVNGCKEQIYYQPFRLLQWPQISELSHVLNPEVDP